MNTRKWLFAIALLFAVTLAHVIASSNIIDLLFAQADEAADESVLSQWCIEGLPYQVLDPTTNTTSEFVIFSQDHIGGMDMCMLVLPKGNEKIIMWLDQEATPFWFVHTVDDVIIQEGIVGGDSESKYQEG